MFSGIIEVIGKVIAIQRIKGGAVRLILDAGQLSSSVRAGDSIAVDGACLTVVRKTGRKILMDISSETQDLTIISGYKKGMSVNLELPVKAGAMMSGHFVQGHVDGVAKVSNWKCSGNQDIRLRIKLPAGLAPYCIHKGSIAINGVSLTIARMNRHDVEIALIPYTLDHTNLGLLKPGDPVNIETDVLGRYIVSMVKKAYHIRRKGN